MADAKKALPPKDVEVPTTTRGLRALVSRAQAGDDTTLPVLRKMGKRPVALSITHKYRLRFRAFGVT